MNCFVKLIDLVLVYGADKSLEYRPHAFEGGER